MINISKGLDLPISGRPDLNIADTPNVSSVSLLSNDFIGMKPTMLVREGDEVKVGTKLFEDKKNDLENAQINKYKKLSNLVKPKVGDKILEIGCGWGGFAEFIGKNYNVELDCITISKKQYEFAKERIYKNGLNEKVNIQMLDYRDCLLYTSDAADE